MSKKLMQLLRDNAQARNEGEQIIRVEATPTEAHVYVYDVIDSWYGASAAGLIEALAGLGDRTVHLHINSPGGDVFEARAMAAALVAHPGNVVSHIDGLAASAATYLALAASEVRMGEGSLFMVHNSWTMAWGNKSELRSTADLLDKIDQTIAGDYARRTGATADQVHAWMDAETWFTAQEALDAKFVDAVDANSKREASAQANAQASARRWNLSAYAHAPKLPAPEPIQDNQPDPAQLDAQVSAQLQANRNRARLLTPI